LSATIWGPIPAWRPEDALPTTHRSLPMPSFSPARGCTACWVPALSNRPLAPAPPIRRGRLRLCSVMLAGGCVCSEKRASAPRRGRLLREEGACGGKSSLGGYFGFTLPLLQPYRGGILALSRRHSGRDAHACQPQRAGPGRVGNAVGLSQRRSAVGGRRLPPPRVGSLPARGNRPGVGDLLRKSLRTPRILSQRTDCPNRSIDPARCRRQSASSVSASAAQAGGNPLAPAVASAAGPGVFALLCGLVEPPAAQERTRDLLPKSSANNDFGVWERPATWKHRTCFLPRKVLDNAGLCFSALHARGAPSRMKIPGFRRIG
jgi:hypothetical protein